MTNILKYLILLLLFSSLAFANRKYMMGGELYVTKTVLDASIPLFTDNHPEESGFLGAGANGYMGIHLIGDDRTGYGHSSLIFNSTTDPNFPLHKTFIGVSWGTTTSPMLMNSWMRFRLGNPQVNTVIWATADSGKTLWIVWKTTGKLALGINGVLVDSTASTVTGAFDNVKLYTTWGWKNGAVKHYLILNNTDTARSSTYMSSTVPSGFQTGMMTTSNDNTQQSEMWLDDLIVNDGSGTDTNFASDNSYIVYSPPVSDTARVDFKDADGSTDSLWNAVDNARPLGTLSGSETKYTNITNNTSSTTANYDAACKAYRYAGMNQTHYVWYAQSFARGSEHDGTGTTQGAVSLVSNPSDTSETLFNYGADVGAHGRDDYTTSNCGLRNCADGKWVTFRGKFVKITTLSMIDMTARPVVRVGRRTATTNRVDVDQMGVVFEANPEPPPGVPVERKGFIINPFGMDFNNSQYFFATSLTQYELH